MMDYHNILHSILDLGLHQDLVIPVTNFHNEDKGFMVLAGDVFDVPLRKDIVHRVVLWQLAKRQQVMFNIYVDSRIMDASVMILIPESVYHLSM